MANENPGQNTSEYKTLVTHTEELKVAIQSDLVSIIAALSAKNLINAASLSDGTELERAAKLVNLIQNEVTQNPKKNYEAFVDTLKARPHYSDIVNKLEKTFSQYNSTQEGMLKLLEDSYCNAGEAMGFLSLGKLPCIGFPRRGNLMKCMSMPSYRPWCQEACLLFLT